MHELLHLGFQIKAVPQNQIGARQRRNVSACLAIGVWVNARAHQCSHLNQVAAHLACRVGDHAGGGNDIELLRLRQRRAGRGKTYGKNQHGACGGEAAAPE